MCILFFQSCLAPGNNSWLIWPNSMMFPIFLISLAAKDGHKTQLWPCVLGWGKDLGKKMLFSWHSPISLSPCLQCKHDAHSFSSHLVTMKKSLKNYKDITEISPVTTDLRTSCYIRKNTPEFA